MNKHETLNTQEGGDHYKKQSIQPWEIIEANNLDYWQGNILKYTMRHKDKNGTEDLKKALHYIQHYINIEERKDESNH